MRLTQLLDKYLDHIQDRTVTIVLYVQELYLQANLYNGLTSFTIDENMSDVLYSHPSLHFSTGQEIFRANIDSLWFKISCQSTAYLSHLLYEPSAYNFVIEQLCQFKFKSAKQQNL